MVSVGKAVIVVEIGLDFELQGHTLYMLLFLAPACALTAPKNKTKKTPQQTKTPLFEMTVVVVVMGIRGMGL